jgi:hypothetical protein
MPTPNDPNENRDMNRDPITGAPGSHPVGVGVGAAAAGATGAAIGTAVGGPIGTAVGAAIGAIAGGLMGKGVAEMIDPTAEAAYWREQHRSQPYATHREYDQFEGAYQTGYEGYGRHYREGVRFEDVEPSLRQDYETRVAAQPGDAGSPGAVNERPVLPWEEARPATQAAWERVDALYRGERRHSPNT